MQTKDITDALGITRERIKYYKKEGVFVPENPVVNGKTEFTDRDFENLKRLVILTKSGLSCADIKKVQTGAKSLREVINDRQNAIREEIERMTGSLALSEELFTSDVQYDSMPTEEYWQFIKRKEQAGEIFMDIDDGYYPVSLSRDIRCPHCGKIAAVDLDDFVYDQSSDENENGMGRTLFIASIPKIATSALNAAIWCGLTAGFESTLSAHMIQRALTSTSGRTNNYDERRKESFREAGFRSFRRNCRR